jgi:hypothetical protein
MTIEFDDVADNIDQFPELNLAIVEQTFAQRGKTHAGYGDDTVAAHPMMTSLDKFADYQTSAWPQKFRT